MLMSVVHRFDMRQILPSMAVGVLGIALVVGFPAPTGAASPAVGAGDRACAPERSETELAIEFLGADTPAAAEARFERLGLGTVEPLPWGPREGRFAILRVARADPETRARARTEGLVRSVRAVYRYRPDGLPHLGTGRIVVRFVDGVGPADGAAIAGAYGARLIQPLGRLPNTYVAEPLDAAADEVALAAQINGDPRTHYAEADLISPLFKTQTVNNDATTNPLGTDPLAPLQWHLRNTGQDGGVIGADINIEGAFDVGVTGAGVVVGMLDDACDVKHEDLLANYINTSHDARTDKASDLAANPVSATERHGTAIMGLMCAVRDNALGVIGVAPGARFTASRGADDGLSASQIANAFEFALAQNVDVHCNSWAGEAGIPATVTVRSAIEQAFTTGRGKLGMVVVFPTGNGGEELTADETLAGLQTDSGHKSVIGVGACNASELVTAYSSYGVGVVDVVAPSSDVFMPQIVTTDNTDASFPDAPGYDNAGRDDFGLANLSNPQYTQGDSFSDSSSADFFGTSAAAAQVAGVAALVLSATTDKSLTATQVRSILAHTADRIPLSDLAAGDYNGITHRSPKYGYGRVNAGNAIVAAQLVSSSNPFTWPEPVKNVTLTKGTTTKTLSWAKNDDVRQLGSSEFGDPTTEVLVVQRIGLDFEWVPTDGQAYSAGQVVDFTQNVTVAQFGNNTSYVFSDNLGITYFGIFTRNAAGRYSFGYSIDSLGRTVKAGHSTNLGEGNSNSNDNSGETPTPVIPTVAIRVAPLSGVTPLTVSFRGNTPESDSPIVSAEWDFGDGSEPVSQSVAEHTYVLVGNSTQTFTATFTVVDADGDEGSRSVVITVQPPEGSGDDTTDGTIRIIVSAAGQTPTDIGSYTTVGSRVELSLDTSRIVGTPEGVFWNLGDGATANSFIVSHVYTVAGTFPIYASVTARTSTGDVLNYTNSRLFTVLDSGNVNTNLNGNANSSSPGTGGSTAPCGVGMLIPLVAMLGVAVLRRLRLVASRA
jgi:hypothetical protein